MLPKMAKLKTDGNLVKMFLLNKEETKHVLGIYFLFWAHGLAQTGGRQVMSVAHLKKFTLNQKTSLTYFSSC